MRDIDQMLAIDREARSVEMRRCLEAVAAEEEFPDDMPDDMWDAISTDRAAATAALRIAVRMTKDSIKQRILDGAS